MAQACDVTDATRATMVTSKHLIESHEMTSMCSLVASFVLLSLCYFVGSVICWWFLKYGFFVLNVFRVT